MGTIGSPAGCVAQDRQNDTSLTRIAQGFIFEASASRRPNQHQSTTAEGELNLGGGGTLDLQGIYAAHLGQRQAITIADTSTPIPGQKHTKFEQFSLPSTDGHSSAFAGCSGAVYSGAFFKANSTGGGGSAGEIKKVADNLTPVPGLQLSYHDILSVSVSRTRVSFFGNFPSGLSPPRLYLGGVFVWDATTDEIATLEITNKHLTGFTAFGD